MKKIASILMMLLAVSFVFAGCGKSGATGADTTKGEGVMTFAEFAAAPVDSQVVVETYIQDKQGWWEKDGVGVATFYTQDAEGGYFLYNMPCTEDEYNNKLIIGNKIKVTGYKAEWSGEVEIVDATWELEDGNYQANPVDITTVIDKPEIANSMNMYAICNDLTVVAQADGTSAVYYNWDNSGNPGDDLYFTCTTANGGTQTFCVESYLRGQQSPLYPVVENLKVGDKISAKCFVYYYEGPQPHVVEVNVQ